MATFKQYSFIIHQLEEAKRFIIAETLPYLRIALILIDNSVELLLDIAMEEELWTDEMRAMLRESTLSIPKAAETPELTEAVSYEPLTRDRKYQISRYFNEKIKYLTDDHSIFDPHIGAVISHLHTYRNAAYHSASIREETILPAVMLYFEISTDLLADFGPSSYSSSDESGWLKRRYALTVSDLFDRPARISIVDVLREGLSMTEEDLKSRLTDHLENRQTDVMDALDFIHDTTSIFSTRDEALRAVQYWREHPSDPIFTDMTQFDQYQPSVEMHHFGVMAKNASTILDAEGRIEAFQIFSEIEKRFEPIETQVNEFAAEIDRAIQLEVDSLRGK